MDFVCRSRDRAGRQACVATGAPLVRRGMHAAVRASLRAVQRRRARASSWTTSHGQPGPGPALREHAEFFSRLRDLTASAFFSSRDGRARTWATWATSSIPSWQGAPARGARRARRELRGMGPEVRRPPVKRPKRLGIGIIGSGFNAQFHLRAFQQVRDCDVLGVWSPNARNAAVDGARWPASSTSGTRSRTAPSPRWWPIPPSTRSGSAGRTRRASRTWRRSSTRIERGRGELIGLACEKPLARNVAEAKEVAALARRRAAQDRLPREPALRAAGRGGPGAASGRAVPALTGRPYLARAAEEHSGPAQAVVLAGASCRVAACSTT